MPADRVFPRLVFFDDLMTEAGRSAIGGTGSRSGRYMGVTGSGLADRVGFLSAGVRMKDGIGGTGGGGVCSFGDGGGDARELSERVRW